jgi:hypothetical protein
MICKRCNKNKNEDAFSLSKDKGIRAPRITGRVCKKCKKDYSKKYKRPKRRRIMNIIKYFYRVGKILCISKKSKQINNIIRRRLRYQNNECVRSQQKQRVKSWISHNKEKHRKYCKNYSNKIRKEIQERLMLEFRKSLNNV